MKLKTLVTLFAGAVCGLAQTPPQIPNTVKLMQTRGAINTALAQIAAIACAGTPGNTTGAYGQQCQTAAGARFSCNNPDGCTVPSDWVAGGGGSAGADGNTVLYGTAAPTTEGVDGNFYIRTSTNYLYGPKAGGVWPSGTSLVGPAGSQGIQGIQGTAGSAGAAGNTVLYGTAAPTTEGVDGNFYIRTSTNYLYGPKAGGVWPSGTSLVGPAGSQGAQGIQGVQGATGSAGAAGAAGAQGPAGPAPSGTGLVKSTSGVAGLAVAGVDFQAAGTVDVLRFGICMTAGCGSETTINYIAAMVAGKFSVCAFNLSYPATGSSVIVDVQDGTGTSIFGATKLVVGIGSTSVVTQATFANSPQTFGATDKFKDVVVQNDSGYSAQGGTVQCR